MSLSIKFKHMGSNLVKILSPIFYNQNILRYCCYLTNNPLLLQIYNDEGQLVDQPDIQESLLDTKSIILTPYDPKVLTDLKVKIFCNPLEGDFRKSINDDLYEFIILVPLKYWVLWGSGELRAFLIAYEIAKELDSQYEIAGTGKVDIIKWRRFNEGDNYAGLVLITSITNGTVRC